jgi:hypothetical protein
MASIACSATFVLRPEADETARWLLPTIFCISALAWLAYMARRAWLMSVPRHI